MLRNTEDLLSSASSCRKLKFWIEKVTFTKRMRGNRKQRQELWHFNLPFFTCAYTPQVFHSAISWNTPARNGRTFGMICSSAVFPNPSLTSLQSTGWSSVSKEMLQIQAWLRGHWGSLKYFSISFGFCTFHNHNFFNSVPLNMKNSWL